MLKKRKHKIRRRNTEPSVNHPMTFVNPQAGGSGVFDSERISESGSQHESPVINLADICDSPTHATPV
jgi:hypothetical protein